MPRGVWLGQSNSCPCECWLLNCWKRVRKGNGSVCLYPGWAGTKLCGTPNFKCTSRVLRETNCSILGSEIFCDIQRCQQDQDMTYFVWDRKPFECLTGFHNPDHSLMQPLCLSEHRELELSHNSAFSVTILWQPDLLLQSWKLVHKLCLWSSAPWSTASCVWLYCYQHFSTPNCPHQSFPRADICACHKAVCLPSLAWESLNFFSFFNLCFKYLQETWFFVLSSLWTAGCWLSCFFPLLSLTSVSF